VCSGRGTELNSGQGAPRRCEECRGTGIDVAVLTKDKGDCESCLGLGWFGINPKLPIPSSCISGPDRIPYYQVRYASGAVIFNRLDELTTVQISDIAKEIGINVSDLIERESTILSEEECQLAHG